MKNKIIIIVFCFVVFQSKVFSVNKKETLSTKVSFLLDQKKDSLVLKEFQTIKKLYEKNKYDESLERAFNILKKNVNTEKKIEIYFLIAEIFRKNNNQTNSILYYKKALIGLNKFNDFDETLESLNLDNIQLSKIYLRLGSAYLRNKQKDSAKFFYNKVLNISSLNDKTLSYQGSASANLSGIYMNDSLYDKAQNYAIKAVQIHRKRNNKISEAVALGSSASIYLDLDNYNKAKETYKQALDLIKFEKGDRALRVKEDLYFNLAYNLYKLKDYEAYTYQEKSYILKDSLRDIEIRRMIEELGFKHNFEAKKDFFQKEEENKRQKAQKLFWIVGIIGLIVIISLVYILKLKNLKQRNLALELSQSELIQNQNLEKLKSESQVRILNATIDGKESERKQIAETLHDSVSALLSSANLHLQATRKQYNGSTPIEIDKTQEIILEASHKIRDLSHNLVSSVLLKFGLDFAIRDIAEKYSNSELKIETEIDEIRRYHQSFEIKGYNIVQEFVNNILKHSEAENALIELKEENKRLFLTISDDGLGFDKTKINVKDGLGINQIDARIQMMKGSFYIDSSTNNGTKISVELPILEKEEPNYV